MKDLPYITHDLGARNDPKLMDLQMEMGGQGLAIFWCIVEMLWENDGYIPANFKSIAFSLRWCKPAEVERVVKDFGLFEIEDGRLFSRSALERIAYKKDRFDVRSGAARKAAEARWGKSGNASVMQSQCEGSAPAMQLTNLLTNKQKDINNTPLTAADFFEIFFFENVSDPAGEVDRFLAYYEDRGWKYQDGSPVKDFERAAKDWKPLKPGKRFKDDLLRWYRAVWNAAKDRLPNAREILLKEIDAIKTEGGKTVLRYRTEASARAAAGFILDNDLAGDTPVDFRIAN